MPHNPELPAQGVHDTGFFVDEKYPGEHGEQTPRFAYVPAAHEEQLEDCAGDTAPGGQPRQRMPPPLVAGAYTSVCHNTDVDDNPEMLYDELVGLAPAGASSITASPLSREMYDVLGRLRP